MGFPISDGTVLAFFDYLKRRHKDIHDLRGLPESYYQTLVAEFRDELIDKFDGLKREDVHWLESNHAYRDLTKQTPPDERAKVFARLQRWSGHDWDCLQAVTNLQNDFHRYYYINNHILFFATEADDLKEYVLRYVNELHELSADFADIFFVVGEHGSWDQGYRLKRQLNSIPGIEAILNYHFPCMFLWSDETYTLLPLAHLQSDDKLLTAYIRQVFDILEIRNRSLDEKMKFEIQELPLSASQNLAPSELDPPAASVDLFISYKREDRKKIEQIVKGLETEGHRAWFDSGIMAGQYFRNLILAQIRASKGVMPVWSSRSIRSPFVQGEADAAVGKLIPVKIERVDPPLPFGELHTLDLIDWDDL